MCRAAKRGRPSHGEAGVVVHCSSVGSTCSRGPFGASCVLTAHSPTHVRAHTNMRPPARKQDHSEKGVTRRSQPQDPELYLSRGWLRLAAPCAQRPEICFLTFYPPKKNLFSFSTKGGSRVRGDKLAADTVGAGLSNEMVWRSTHRHIFLS